MDTKGKALDRPRTKGNNCCCVEHCGRRGSSGFFAFPSKFEVREKWLQFVGRKFHSPSMKICQKHFKEDDYCLESAIGRPLRRKQLKKCAVPSLNLGNNCHSCPLELSGLPQLPASGQQMPASGSRFNMKSVKPIQNEDTRAKFISTKEGLMAALVVKEFLEYFDLEFSTSVYKKEMMQGQEHMDASREQLVASLEFDENNVEGPLVLELLKLSKVFFRKKELNLAPLNKSCIKLEPLCLDTLEHQNQNISVQQMHQDTAVETLIVDTIEFEQDPLCPDGTVKEEHNVEIDQHHEPIPPILNQFEQDPLCPDGTVKEDGQDYKVDKHVSEDSGVEIKCETCQATFTSIHYLTRHIAIVHNGSADEPSKSSFQLKKNAMKSPAGIVNEEDNVELDPDYNVESESDHEPPTVLLNNKHVSEVSGEEIKCKVCEVTFTKIHSLRRHIAVIHGGNADEQPKWTPKSRHNAIRSGPKSTGKHKCDICHVKYSTPSNLRSHIAVVHKGIAPFKCEHCDKGFSSQSLRKEHVGSVHLKIKNFHCDFCSYSSYYIKRMKEHVFMRHDNSTIVKCDHCKLTFKGQAVLYKHKLDNHSTVLCAFCGRVLSDQCSLEHHVQSYHKHQSDSGDGIDEMK